MIILPANTLSSGGYDVANSCRFDSASSSYLHRTPSATGNPKKFTYSLWVKFSKVDPGNFMVSGSGSSSYFIFGAYGGGDIDIVTYTGYVITATTGRLFRDLSSWYHVVLACDTTQASFSDGIKLYINGVLESSFATQSVGSENGYTQDTSLRFGTSGEVMAIGANSLTSQGFWDGYIAECAFVNDQQLAPTEFGEFDEDSPRIWKPKDISGLTFGTNGFYLDFKDSSNLGNDVSGNNNDFTSVNLDATNQAIDTPTNNFATMNPLNVPTSNAPTFKEGALETESATTSGQRFMGSSTIGLTAGKWYAECKIVVIDSATVGISPDVAVHAKDNTYIGSHAHDWSILPETGVKYNNDSGTTHGDAFSTNDILMIALDLDNNNVYFGRNGNWFDGSGNADEAAPNSALSLTAPASTPEGAYFFACSDGGGSAKAKVQWNFGNPPFSISSGNSDANGYGNFEYAVPSNYFSLCTKNLAEYGG